MSENEVFEFQKPLRVIVVEDNEVDRRMLEAMLTDIENATSFLKVTNSAKVALELLETTEFDVIVLDLNLPDSNGLETLELVHERFPHLAIVVNTGAYEDELGLKTLGKGAQDFLVKGKYTAYVLNKVLHYSVERKRLQQDLLKTNRSLQEMQDQLIQAEKLKVVGGLASGIAHEVKNPLATILYGVTYLFENLKEPSENVDLVLKNIKESTNRANEIIMDLLNFANVSRLNQEQVFLEEVIDKARALITHEFDKKQIRMIKAINTKEQVRIDVNRIIQVLINVFLNGIQAMEKGQNFYVNAYTKKLLDSDIQKYQMSLKNFNEGEDVYVLEVVDEGEGIAEENLKYVFDPFFTTKRPSGGVGLGLSVSRNIMDIHKGNIQLQNAPDKGAIATLVFKLSNE